MQLPRRHAVSRAELFVELADQCPFDQNDQHEAFLEAALVFCRTALHRLQTRYEKNPAWKSWWDGLLPNESVGFTRKERDFILKEAPPKIGQIAYAGSGPTLAKYSYYYEDRHVPAVDTVRRHVAELKRLVLEAEAKFGDGSPIEA